jgi:hypothetical protein
MGLSLFGVGTDFSLERLFCHLPRHDSAGSPEARIALGHRIALCVARDAGAGPARCDVSATGNFCEAAAQQTEGAIIPTPDTPTVAIFTTRFVPANVRNITRNYQNARQRRRWRTQAREKRNTKPSLVPNGVKKPASCGLFYSFAAESWQTRDWMAALRGRLSNQMRSSPSRSPCNPGAGEASWRPLVTTTSA